MEPFDGLGFAYEDQAAAERHAQLMRDRFVDLIGELEALNKDLDSVRLQQLIESEKVRAGL